MTTAQPAVEHEVRAADARSRALALMALIVQLPDDTVLAVPANAD